MKSEKIHLMKDKLEHLIRRGLSKELPAITFSASILREVETPALVVGLFEGEGELSGEVAALDRAIGRKISQIIASKDFTGKQKQVSLVYPEKGGGIQRIFLVGLGERKKATLDTIRSAASVGVKAAKKIGVPAVAIPFDLATGWQDDRGTLAEAAFLGAALGAYDYRELKDVKKKKDKKERIDTIMIIGDDEAKRGAERGRVVADSVYLARDLSNAPANLMTPRLIARRAREIGRRYQIITDIYGPKDLKKMKMGAFLGVARGSEEPAYLIVMEYVPKVKKAKAVALVGKGITFDSGGISIKPASGMEEMKTDMSGAAAVIGAVVAAARLKLDIGVIGIVPATENMPGGSALKPGDVVTAMDGTTIEIISTDAEGRLILADALCFASKYDPAAIIDVATLTGAAVIALGSRVAALYASDEKLLDNIKEASKLTGEMVWPMPRFPHYDEQLKSDVADIKNVGGREAGSVTGAAFLKRFAGDKIPWAHIDMAGTARAEKDYDWVKKGATGYGVMLLLKTVELLKP